MTVACISNNDQCVPLLQYLKQSGQQAALYIGRSYVNDGKREQLTQHCKTLGISFHKEDGAEDKLYSWITAVHPDIVFVLGHISIIKIDRLPAGLKIYNIHFGKLPEYRGASPVFWQLKNGESTVGCAIHELDDKIDTGAIIWQKEIPFEEYYNWNYLNFLFSNLVTEGVHYIVREKMNGRTPTGVQQEEVKALYNHQPALKDVLINWETMNAAQICSLVRACDTWNNGAITLFNGMEVKIRDASETEPITGVIESPGTISNSDSRLSVRCAENTQLLIHSLAINEMIFPARFAVKYGFIKGQQFAYPSD